MDLLTDEELAAITHPGRLEARLLSNLKHYKERDVRQSAALRAVTAERDALERANRLLKVDVHCLTLGRDHVMAERDALRARVADLEMMLGL